jgi:hypothetical protein
MKIVFSILLLLITGIYILPVKETLKSGSAVCMADMDSEKEDCSKKEKNKDLFSYINTAYVIVNNVCNNKYHHISFCIPALLHTVETPPPDLA